jgi:hypothetical protein
MGPDVTAPSRTGLGWVYGFEGKCLKDGLRNGAEASLPVRLAQSSSPGARLSAGSALTVASSFAAAARFGAHGNVFLTPYCRIQKARDGCAGAGLILATMKICR